MSEGNQNPSSEASEITRRTALAAAGATGLAAMTGGDAKATEQKDNQKGDFSPNRCSFQDGIDQVKAAVKGSKFDSESGRIVTSRNEGAKDVLNKLRVSNIPGGFTKYQLPVYFEGGPGSQFYISVGNPNQHVPRHSHDEGDGLRYIISGSIIYEGQELTAGDWMFIPKGQPYSFEVGPLGAQMFYCYQCCCR